MHKTEQVTSAPNLEAHDRAAVIGVLATACISTFVVNANTSAVAILLPSISEDTNTDISTLQWAVTGYMLVGAAFIVGRVLHLFGMDGGQLGFGRRIGILLTMLILLGLALLAAYVALTSGKPA